MAVEIYTYRDPYMLHAEPYWDETRACPYFCVSQTLVRGLHYLYRNEFVQGRVTTVQNLVDTMFEQWESTACKVKQHAAIDNLISSGLSPMAAPTMQENLAQAFRFNREEVFNSLRVMVELNVNTDEIVFEKLTPEQLLIVELYKKILTSEQNEDFTLRSDFDEAYIDHALDETMQKAGKGRAIPEVTKDSVVIHGIHQFSPLMLRMIEALSMYKKVILLFNYQPQYQHAYQTWIDIYSAFDCPIVDFGGSEFTPDLNQVSYVSNILADNLGKLISGQTSDLAQSNTCEIIEFDNMTEFAGYVADVFESAAKVDAENPMGKMREQFYSANSSVNDILRLYFPEQFGERQFLDYPLGHFFLAIADLWDVETNEIVIEDMADIEECFASGILKEAHLGQLTAIFSRLTPLFEGCTSMREMRSRLKRLRKNQRYLTDDNEKESVSHISYYTVNSGDIQTLDRAFRDLEKIAAYFYEDFEKHPHNFRAFYKRLKQYLQQDILDLRELSEEFTDIIRRVLERLEEVEEIDASASFACLKATMSIYLKQEAPPGTSANWIVKGFEQIDGDIVRSLNEQVNGKPVVCHFACLSDQDINAGRRAPFPWPLTEAFFEVAQEPVDWKYQVYVKAKKEYKNFKRYALLFGLEFNRGHFKLSYVKRDGDQEKNPYYLFQILGVRVTPYEQIRRKQRLEEIPALSAEGIAAQPYSAYDYYRYRICKYRFLLESLLEGTTVYKDAFLLVKYLEVLLENQVREALQGLPVSEMMVVNRLNEAFAALEKYFPFVRNVNRLDAISTVRNRLLSGKSNAFPRLTDSERRDMRIRELFLRKQLADPKRFRRNILQDKFPEVTEEQIAEELSASALHDLNFRSNVDAWCQYCANRELCAACCANAEL